MSDLRTLNLAPEASPDIYEQWLNQVANQGVKRHYYDVVQTGGKEGVRYACHIIDVVSLAAALRPIFPMDALEQRILYSALSIHDLNKSPLQQAARKRASFAEIATQENIIAECTALELDAFFPEWRDNIRAIQHIINGHSGKYQTGLARHIPIARQAENISDARLEQLIHLTKAVDAFALMRDFAEVAPLRKGLLELNSIVPQQYETAWHRLSEQRGLLSNVLHRAASLELQEQGWIPLLLFPEGSYYLKPVDSRLASDTNHAIALRFAKRLQQLGAQKFADFIKAKPLGISIDKQIIDMEVASEDIWHAVDAIILKRKERAAFKSSEQEAKCRKDLEALVSKSDTSEAAHAFAQQWLEHATFFPQSQAGMATGELLRSYYIFLNSHAKAYFKQHKQEPWDYLYDFLAIPNEAREVFSVLDKRNHRPYVVAKEQIGSREVLLERIIEDAAQFLRSPDDSALAESELADYARETLHLSHLAQPEMDFAGYLQNYMDDSHKSCAYGSSKYPSVTWMSVDVPQGIKVQQFSNRLPAGSKREPKRNVSPVVQAQFQLENLGYASSKNKALYLHCMPYTFLTEPYLKALRSSLRAAYQSDMAAGMLQVDDILKRLKEDANFNIISLKATKGNGLPLPSFSEELVGNVMTFPLNSLGNDSERYLEALPYAFLLARFFGVKVLLSESALPTRHKEEIKEVYLDGIPALFRGLFREENLAPLSHGEYQGKIPAWECYIRLRQISRQLYSAGSKRNGLLELVSAYLKGELELFHVADRLLEAKSNQSSKGGDFATIRLSQRILPLLEQSFTFAQSRA